LLEILAAKFKFKLKFLSSILFIFKGKLSYLGSPYKIFGAESAHALFQALILKNKLYVNKIIHRKINSLGKEKQQNLQVYFCIRILILLYKNQIKYNKYIQA
jgi:hypothetical protein